jgi:hypothetical protein
MECPSCHAQTPGIIDESSLWCDKCGTCIRANYVFVVGYHNRHTAPRQQIYCSAKRFTKYVQKHCSSMKHIMEDVNDIIDMYSSLEFAWCCHRSLSKRIYFFAKPVMLKFCCALLELSLEGLPKLKDKNREVVQFQDLLSLQGTPTFLAHR